MYQSNSYLKFWFEEHDGSSANEFIGQFKVPISDICVQNNFRAGVTKRYASEKRPAEGDMTHVRVTYECDWRKNPDQVSQYAKKVRDYEKC